MEDKFSDALKRHEEMDEFKKELAELLGRYEVGRLTDSQIPNHILTDALMQSLKNIVGFQHDMDYHFISG